MNLVLLTAQGADFHPNRRLLEAARVQGHQMDLWHPFRLWPGVAGGRPLLGPQGLDLRGVGAVLPRLGATVSGFSLALVAHLEAMGLRVVNGARAMGLARDKFLTASALAAAGLPVPDTFLVGSRQDYRQALDLLGGPPVVVKLPAARQGAGVFRVDETGDDPLIDGAPLMAFVERRRGVVVQRYLPPQGRRDFRLLVVGGQVFAAVEVTPREGDFRANVHQGGAAQSWEPSAEARDLALSAAQALGLELAGVDLMAGPAGLVVGELNFSPGFQGLEAATGRDAAAAMVDLMAGSAPARH